MMDFTIEVAPFDAEIEAAYARLFTQEGEVKSPAFLKWRFAKNPHGNGYFALARHDGRIIGMIALIATKFHVDGKPVNGIQAVDTIVSPEAQGNALFSRMGQAIYYNGDVHGADFLWGFPNAQAKRGWFGRLGWSRLGTVPFVAKPLRTGYLLSRLSSKLASLDFPIGGIFGARSGQAEIAERFGTDVQNLCDLTNGSRPVMIEYSPQYLNWRLFDCPNQEYRVVVHRDAAGQIIAMVATFIADKHGTRIAYLMEALGDPSSGAELGTLLRSELHHARCSGASLSLGWNIPTSPNSRTLRRAGFFPLPDRLRPVEMHFGARPLTNDIPTAIQHRGSWYLSYLNSDTV